MPGVLSVFLPSPPHRPEIVCVECGHVFRPATLADAEEPVCDDCYRRESEPLRLPHWQHQRREHHVR